MKITTITPGKDNCPKTQKQAVKEDCKKCGHNIASFEQRINLSHNNWSYTVHCTYTKSCSLLNTPQL